MGPFYAELDGDGLCALFSYARALKRNSFLSFRKQFLSFRKQFLSVDLEARSTPRHPARTPPRPRAQLAPIAPRPLPRPPPRPHRRKKTPAPLPLCGLERRRAGASSGVPWRRRRQRRRQARRRQRPCVEEAPGNVLTAKASPAPRPGHGPHGTCDEAAWLERPGFAIKLNMAHWGAQRGDFGVFFC